MGPGSKKERGTERKRKKKKERKARLYCMNEGPRVRKLRKNQEFQDAGSSHHGSAEMNLTSIHKDASLIPGLTHWVKDPVLP